MGDPFLFPSPSLCLFFNDYWWSMRCTKWQTSMHVTKTLRDLRPEFLLIGILQNLIIGLAMTCRLIYGCRLPVHTVSVFFFLFFMDFLIVLFLHMVFPLCDTWWTPPFAPSIWCPTICFCFVFFLLLWTGEFMYVPTPQYVLTTPTPCQGLVR